MTQNFTQNQIMRLNEFLQQENLTYQVLLIKNNSATIESMGHCVCGKNDLTVQLAIIDFFRQENISIVFEDDNMHFSIVECRKKVEVVAAIIRDRDRIFATQRGYGEFKDGWEFPGGKMESGETPQQALVREIKEELDTIIEVGDLLETIEYDYPKFHLTMHCFMCTIESGDLVLREHEAARWLTKDTLDSVEWLPADLAVIENISTMI